MNSAWIAPGFSDTLTVEQFDRSVISGCVSPKDVSGHVFWHTPTATDQTDDPLLNK